MTQRYNKRLGVGNTETYTVTISLDRLKGDVIDTLSATTMSTGIVISDVFNVDNVIQFTVTASIIGTKYIDLDWTRFESGDSDCEVVALLVVNC